MQVIARKEPNEEYANKLPRYLEVYLRCNNRDYTDWSCKIQCEFILLSKDSNRDKIRKGAYNFNKIENSGFAKFVSYTEINDESNGYLMHDSITLRVFLKAEKVVRKSDL